MFSYLERNVIEKVCSRGFEKKIVENAKNDKFVDEIETKSSFLW